MRAINLFAGIGTMTRAFLAQGAKIIWAQEEVETAAAVYRCNFPQISFYEGALENGMEQIPEHDLLLASIRCPSYWGYELSSAKSSRAEKKDEEKGKTDIHLELLGKVLKKHNPSAVCIMLPGTLREIGSIVHKVKEILSEEGYYSMWALLRGNDQGRVPFQGKKNYLVAFRAEGMSLKFTFPEAGKMLSSVKELPQWHVKEEEQYYAIPGWCKEVFRNEKTETGKIYSILPRKSENGIRKFLKEYDSCPVLTENSWYRTFVMDEKGIRKITPEEYLSMQGDKWTKFPTEMRNREIWEMMKYAGIYGIEDRLASDILQILEESSFQAGIAGHLLKEFDNESFLYRKKAGMICMPVGAGHMETIKYLVQGILKRTGEKWKLIVLGIRQETCRQLRQILENSGFSVRISASFGDTDDFLTDRTEILIMTYMGWANYIRQCPPEGVHINLILLGAGAERGWRYLADTEKYFPQAVYAGVASVPDAEAEEVFGQIRYQYTLQQACTDHLMVPVSIDYLNAPDEFPALAEKIWKDMLVHGEKTLIIAEDVSQAQRLQQNFLQYCMETEEIWKIYLCVSVQDSKDREEQIHAFRNFDRSVLITVEMWKEQSVPDMEQIYVLGRVGEHDLIRVLSLASGKYPGKETGRVVILDQELSEKAQVLTGVKEDNKNLVSFCTHLWNGEYTEAATDFERIRESSERLSEQIKKELGVWYDRRVSEMGQRDEKRCQYMVRLWLLMSKLTVCWEKFQDWKIKEVSVKESTADKSRQETKMQEQDFAGNEMAVFQNSAEKGAILENALLRLLRRLFTWNRDDNPDLEEKTEAVLHFLQKKPGGDQNGRDLDLIYLDKTGQRRRCHFECKYIQSKKLTEERILAKIQQDKRHAIAAGEIEHWILVAPKSRLDKHAAELFEEAEQMPGKYYPIKNIQVWSEESCVSELLGIEPELYEIFYGRQSGKGEEPVNWSTGKKNEIVRKWKQKLMPVIMLPVGLHFYPFQPEKVMFELQNDMSVRERYESLFHYRVKMSFYKDNQEALQNYPEEDMADWLFSESCQTRLLLGEFASGKTFFLYCLCRKLLAEFVNNPEKNYIPICISLKNLREVNTPAELIERRMKELGCSYGDFYSLKQKFHVLVCLDGFDEITSVIDDKTIGKNIRLLVKCCEYLTGAKILITSRPQCFEKNDIKRWLSERLGGLEVLYMAPVGHEAGEQFVLFGTEEEERMERWEQISGNRNIRALMEKPFFLDMIRLILESGEMIGESAVSVYEHYIRECLKRKFDNSFDREDMALTDRGETIDRIYHALCSMAYRLQKQGDEVVQVSEFASYLGESAEKILWMEESAGKDIRQDADNRFSMRTLLKYADADNEKVEFSHRSIREYFVAVYLWNLLKDNHMAFKEELEKNYFSHEILCFLAELIQGEPSKSEENQNKLIKLVEQDTTETNLSAKIMQILYYANKDRKIPKACWSAKNLTDIHIPGADLSGQNLRGTIFINANLNNVRLDSCDCSYCNMTGVRLGESGKILLLRYEDSELLCLYDDGCMRRWDIQRLEEKSNIDGIPVMEQAVWGEHGVFFVQNKAKIRTILLEDNLRYVSQEYAKRNNRRLLSISGELLLLREEDQTGIKLLLINIQDGSVLREWMVEEGCCGVIADGGLVVVYDGRNTIELFYAYDCEKGGVLNVDKRGNMIALDVCLKGETVSILSGYSDGAIWGYRCKEGILVSKVESKLYGLVHLTFCGDEIAALADSEGGIHQALLDYDHRRIHMDWKETMKLSIYCKNIKTDGLIPENIRLRLKDRSV